MTITAVLDTNVFVSAAMSRKGAPGKLMALLEAEAYGVVMSSAILEAIADVMRYPKIATTYHLTEDWIVEYLNHLRDVVTWTEPDVKLNVIEEDPSDNKYLECAVSAGAQYIISGDKHLLGLRSYQGVEILTPAAFLMLFGEHKTNELTDFRLARSALSGGPDGSRGAIKTSKVTFLPRHIAQEYLPRLDYSRRTEVGGI